MMKSPIFNSLPLSMIVRLSVLFLIAVSLQKTQAQETMSFPEVIRTIETEGRNDIIIKPYGLRSNLDSIILLHTRMATDLHAGSVTGTAQNLTLENDLYSKGTLRADGATDLGGALTVTGETSLLNNLNIAQNATIAGNMSLSGNATFAGTMNITGGTAIQSNFDVNGNATVSGTLGVTGTTDLKAATIDGQLRVKGVAASDYSADQTPAMVIELEGVDNPHRNTNFIEFQSGDLTLGRVEGMNMTQEWASYGNAFETLLSSTANAAVGTVVNGGMSLITSTLGENDNQGSYDTYSSGQSPTSSMSNLLGTFTTDFGIGLVDGSVGLVKDIGSAIVNIWGCCYLGAGCDDIVDELMDVVVDGISLGLHVYGNAGWTGSGVGDGGIAFESVGADYAEWLAKSNPTETLVPGEIVGMRAGAISKHFSTADKFMVVSTNPTVVGAMPDAASENAFARVAFMGQVPVRVTGPVQKGDFILPSGHGDGLGMGVRPEAMTTADYARIVGTAWENSEPNAVLSSVNVAVGLNDHLLAHRVVALEAAIAALQQSVEALSGTTTPEATTAAMPFGSTTGSTSTPTKAPSLSHLVENRLEKRQAREAAAAAAKTAQIKGVFEEAVAIAAESGFDLASMPYLEEIFNDPLNVELRDEATAHYRNLHNRLSSIQGMLHHEMQRRSEATEASRKPEDKRTEPVDPFFMVKVSPEQLNPSPANR